MRRAAKIDANQNQVVKDLRKLGFSVAITSSIGSGFPDLVVANYHSTILVELKDGNKSQSRQKLTADEVKFMDTWKGVAIVANSLDEILKYFKK